MHSYYSELRSDLEQFELVETTGEPASYEDVHALYTEPTMFIGSAITEPKPRHLRKEMKTRLGRHIRMVLQNCIAFGEDASEAGCCDEAEWRLIANIDDQSVVSPFHRSPIIVTKKGEPVGIIKSYGEPSLYVLTTDIQRGLVAQTISTIDQPPAVPLSNHVWTIPLDFIGPVHPIRFSQFAIPVTQRKDLVASAKQSTTLDVSHEDIVNQAQQLMRTARPLIATLGSSATTYRPPAGRRRVG